MLMPKKNKCPNCDYICNRTQYTMHIKEAHHKQYIKLVDNIKDDIKNSLCIKDIAEKHFITQKFVKEIIKENNITINEQPVIYNATKKSTIKWEPDNFNLEISTVWSFPNRGNWATHTGKYRGNWSPYIPRNVILRYSQEGDIILDQFVGSGTTLVETKLLNRKGIGIDINPSSIELAIRNTSFDRENCGEVHLKIGDARSLKFIDDESIDLICTHPPYANIIKYSENIEGDLSHYDIDDFLTEMNKVAEESYRVLKKGKFCAILIGDTRRKGHIIPLGFSVMETFRNNGFRLKEIVIKEQHNCSSTGYWRSQSTKYNFLLIAHEYLYIFKKQ